MSTSNIGYLNNTHNGGERFVIAFSSKYTDDQFKWMIAQCQEVDKCFEIRISYPKIAQKSYGNEKRFISPPPFVELGGSLLLLDKQSNNCNLLSPHDTSRSITAPAAVFSSNANHQALEKNAVVPLERSGQHHVSIDQDGNSVLRIHMSVWNEMAHNLVRFKKYYLARSLYSSDFGSWRETRLTVTLHKLFPYQHIATFSSSPVNIISKPTIKTSNNSCNLSISSGMNIALFNRLRSQATSTMYLHVAENDFMVSNHVWSSIAIYALALDDDDDDSDTTATVIPGVIKCGMKIMLHDDQTAVSLPPMYIRGVGKNGIKLSSEDVVSQLHRYAFEIVDKPENFLSCDRQGNLTLVELYHLNSNVNCVPDSACWTLASTETQTYKWFSASGDPVLPLTHSVTYNPIPTVTSVSSICSGMKQHVVNINGHDFLPFYDVWFEQCKARTMYRSPEQLLATISASELSVNNIHEEVKIFITHPHGFVFPTGHSIQLEEPAPSCLAGDNPSNIDVTDKDRNSIISTAMDVRYNRLAVSVWGQATSSNQT